MTKGYNGESCDEAVKNAIGRLGNCASAQDLFSKVKQMGAWSDDNIWQTLMATIINLRASYEHWPTVKLERRCLLLRENGDYELYQPEQHGIFRQGRRV